MANVCFPANGPNAFHAARVSSLPHQHYFNSSGFFAAILYCMSANFFFLCLPFICYFLTLHRMDEYIYIDSLRRVYIILLYTTIRNVVTSEMAITYAIFLLLLVAVSCAWCFASSSANAKYLSALHNSKSINIWMHHLHHSNSKNNNNNKKCKLDCRFDPQVSTQLHPLLAFSTKTKQNI